MEQLTRLEDEPTFGAIFLQLIKSAFLSSDAKVLDIPLSEVSVQLFEELPYQP